MPLNVFPLVLNDLLAHRPTGGEFMEFIGDTTFGGDRIQF